MSEIKLGGACIDITFQSPDDRLPSRVQFQAGDAARGRVEAKNKFLEARSDNKTSPSEFPVLVTPSRQVYSKSVPSNIIITLSFPCLLHAYDIKTTILTQARSLNLPLTTDKRVCARPATQGRGGNY